MAYNARAVREHRCRQREGKLWLRIEVDEADLVATLLRKDNAMPAGR